MPGKPKHELITARFFQWRLYARNGVWCADGRANRPATGRHSLGTRDRDEALRLLHVLDTKIAVDRGLAKRSNLDQLNASSLSVFKGFEQYKQHLQRPRIAGGVRPSTYTNYCSVIKKFQEFCQCVNVQLWREVSREVVERYAAKLEQRDYRSKSIRNEIVTLLQCQKWLIDSGYLEGVPKIQLKLRKIESQRNYCYRLEEYQAIVRFCQKQSDLTWLGNIIVALAYTGMRITELLTLRWSNIDLERGNITLYDETGFASSETKRVQLKSGRGRTLEIATDLKSLLLGLTKIDPVFRGPENLPLNRRKVLREFKSKVVMPLMKQDPKLKPGEFGRGGLHSFRHFFISMAANQGIPIQTLMSWVGHQNSDMIRHYYTLHDSEAKRQIKKLKFEAESGDQTAGLQSEKNEPPKREMPIGPDELE